MPCAEGYKGGVKSPLSAQALARQWGKMMHGTEEVESCGLRHELSFDMVSETPEGYIRCKGDTGTSGTSNSEDMRRVRN